VNKKSIVYVAPALGPDVNRIARLLYERGELQALVTRLILPDTLRRVLDFCGMHRLARRGTAPVPSGKVLSKLLADLPLVRMRLFGGSRIRATDSCFWQVDHLAERCLNHDTRLVIGREDGCAETFARARDRGIRTLYQFPSVFFRTAQSLMVHEREAFPNVCLDADDAYEHGPARLDRKRLELEHADFVLCHSQFVMKSVLETGFNEGRVACIPFGTGAEEWQASNRPKEPVFLYVGNISVRKGVHRVLLAWKKLQAYRTHKLRLIGDMQLTSSFLQQFRGMYEHLPRMPRAALQEHYQAAHAVVFNAVADGFGHVIAESMACGTPVIASRNSGAPDLIEDGEHGLLVDFGDQERLEAKIDWALTNANAMLDMGHRARAKAVEASWERFTSRFSDMLARISE
jgi:glycosyltransferase involved in cell wall biosynthesis